MHSVEKVRWEEDWRIDEKGLFLTSARIVGMGAGMEPPSDAFFKWSMALHAYSFGFT